MLIKKGERGQGLLEYALIFLLVVLIILIVFVVLGPAVGNMYSNVVVNF
jgi:pilus assembly protein Flp/PilA